MTTLGRRSFLASTAALGLTGVTARATAAPALVHRRLTLPSGVQSGDVTTSSAVLWARSDGPGRLMAEISSGHRSWYRTGRIAGAESDFTAKLDLTGLAPGREYQVDLWFEDQDGLRRRDRARTLLDRLHAPVGDQLRLDRRHRGQGWGINADIGGLLGYRAMHATRPDFFIHSGDTIYADGPIAAAGHRAGRPGLAQPRHRGGHQGRRDARPSSADGTATTARREHPRPVRRRPGDRPVGRPRDPQQLVPRRRSSTTPATPSAAWTSSPPAPARPGRNTCPIADLRAHDRSDRVRARPHLPQDLRGPQLDVFCLDMRTFKDPNTAGKETGAPHPRPGAGGLADPRGQPVQGHLEGDRRRPAARAHRPRRPGEPGVPVQPRPRRPAGQGARDRRPCSPRSSATG